MRGLPAGVLCLVLGLLLAPSLNGQQPPAETRSSTETLPGTEPLSLNEPLDVWMVRSINRFADEELTAAPLRPERNWDLKTEFPKAFAKSIAPHREQFRTLTGVVDSRLPATSPVWQQPSADHPSITWLQVPVFEGVHAHACLNTSPSAAQPLSLQDQTNPRPPTVLIIPDPQWSAEDLLGQTEALPPQSRLASRLSEQGISSLIIPLLGRQDEFSGHPEIRWTNQSHREFIYRPAFEMGRHVIGYEIQKVLALVDRLSSQNQPVVIWGIGEGGLIALYAAALDERIDACVVSAYFQEREGLASEPIDHNVWRLLSHFGDANIARMVAPRTLIIEACSAPETAGPPEPRNGRAGAAPGEIKTPQLASVEREFARAESTWKQLGAGQKIHLVRSGADGTGPCGTEKALSLVTSQFKDLVPSKPVSLAGISTEEITARDRQRQAVMVSELRRKNEEILNASHRVRDQLWKKQDLANRENWAATRDGYARMVEDELIGRIERELLPARPRTRKVLETPDYTGYEVALDVYRSEASDAEPFIAGGILLLPKNMAPGEKRPCVVCQHGLEGTPMDTITSDTTTRAFAAYKGYAEQLVRKGYVVYSPQNPYRGFDQFRMIQRKSNPLGRSLFSYIIPQHRQTLRWLASLPQIDESRIAFYGLSYGGKTAMRVPQFLTPRPATANSPAEPGYCLSICSGDFNEWVRKNATTEAPFSYVFTNEYEIFEWNMAHVANYSELAFLMAPRPFMVERGHQDAVAIDEWVAYEFARVQRFYTRQGIKDLAEIEYFDGPHTINGQGTYNFLSRHLNWPAR